MTFYYLRSTHQEEYLAVSEDYSVFEAVHVGVCDIGSIDTKRTCNFHTKYFLEHFML